MVSEAKQAGPIEIDSPLEFILVSSAGRRRRVVVKSKGAGLDLIAHAKRAGVPNKKYRSLFPSFFPFLAPTDLEPIVIDSTPVDPISTGNSEDDRPSSFTFVWRGSRNQRFDTRIVDEFERRVPDLVEALAEDAPWQVEWILSELIDGCHRSIKATTRRLRLYVYTFWFTLVAYGLAAIYIFLVDLR